MFQTKVVEKIKTNILRSVTFSRKSYRLCDYVLKYVRARQVTVDDMCVRFACWITNATGTHSEYELLIAFPWQLWLCLYVQCLFIYIYIYFLKNSSWPSVIFALLLQRGKAEGIPGCRLDGCVTWPQFCGKHYPIGVSNLQLSTSSGRKACVTVLLRASPLISKGVLTSFI